jgi:hypothetical protein
MTWSRWRAPAAGALALVAAAWLALSPYLALAGMRDAIAARDYAALDGYVDYPSLRTSIKEQLAAEAVRRAPVPGHGVEQAALALAIASPVVDLLIRPATLAAILAGDEDDRLGLPRVSFGRGVHVRRTGIARFVVERGNHDGGAVFALRGLRWTLVGIEFPASAGA